MPYLLASGGTWIPSLPMSKSLNLPYTCFKWNLLVHDEKLLLLDSCRDLDISSLLPSSVKFLLCLSFWVRYWKSSESGLRRTPTTWTSKILVLALRLASQTIRIPSIGGNEAFKGPGRRGRRRGAEPWINSKDNWMQILKWFFTKSLKQININEREFCSQRSAWCQVKDVKTDFNCPI